MTYAHTIQGVAQDAVAAAKWAEVITDDIRDGFCGERAYYFNDGSILLIQGEEFFAFRGGDDLEDFIADRDE
jgi:hypothetical protein